MKLTKKDLGPYLGCGIEVVEERFSSRSIIIGIYDNLENETCVFTEGGSYNLNEQEAKPIFRRLSTELAQEITEGGETFVPIDKLVEIKKKTDPSLLDSFSRNEIFDQVVWCKKLEIDLLPYWLVKQMQEWKFWLGDESYFDEGVILDNKEYNVY